MFMHTNFAKELQTKARIKGHIVKTNVLKKNKMYKKIADTLEFLWKYTDVGYAMTVVEQSRQIDETMQLQIFNNIFFNYLSLKGYLENEDGRQIPETMKERKRTIKPKFVKHFANIRAEMIKGLNLFHEETLSGAFPTPEYSFNKAVEIPSVYGPGNN